MQINFPVYAISASPGNLPNNKKLFNKSQSGTGKLQPNQQKSKFKGKPDPKKTLAVKEYKDNRQALTLKSYSERVQEPRPKGPGMIYPPRPLYSHNNEFWNQMDLVGPFSDLEKRRKEAKSNPFVKTLLELSEKKGRDFQANRDHILGKMFLNFAGIPRKDAVAICVFEFLNFSKQYARGGGSMIDLTDKSFYNADARQVATNLLDETEACMWVYATDHFVSSMSVINNLGFRDLLVEGYAKARNPAVAELTNIAKTHNVDRGFASILNVFIIPNMVYMIDVGIRDFKLRANYTTAGEKFTLEYNIEESFYYLNSLEAGIINLLEAQELTPTHSFYQKYQLNLNNKRIKLQNSARNSIIEYNFNKHQYDLLEINEQNLEKIISENSILLWFNSKKLIILGINNLSKTELPIGNLNPVLPTYIKFNTSDPDLEEYLVFPKIQENVENSNQKIKKELLTSYADIANVLED